MKITCTRCRCQFRVEEPKFHSDDGRPVERTRCSEPRCGRPFWHDQRADSYAVRMGIEPSRLKDWGR